ncbi:MAG: T9SS type A sorting domain-containing protein, partial [Cyclobacteriaceae bacterium]
EQVCMSNSFMVFSMSLSNTSPDNLLVSGEISSATTLNFERDGSAGTVTIKWQVFEFSSGVTVQHGNSTNVGNTAVAITAVDLTKSFVIATGRNNGSTFGSDDSFSANLTTSTNLQLVCTGSGHTEIFWQVVQYDDAIVKKVTGSVIAGNTSGTSTISPAVTNLGKTMVIGNHTISGNVNADDLPQTELTNATTVTYTRLGNSAQMDFVTYVVEFTDETTVTRGNQAFASTVTSQNAGITASTTTSGIIPPGNQTRQGSTSFATDDNMGHVWFTYEITSSSNLLIERATGTAGGNSTATAPWQIVTFGDRGTTYYSFATGAWEANTSWSLSSDGSSGAVPAGVFPGMKDNVVIGTGHNITINNVADNGYCGISPNNLNRSNVGTFTGSGDAMFYHIGDIVISNGGTLTSTEEVMLEGYTHIEAGGTLNVNEDIVNLGYLEVSAATTFSNTDDLILSGNSITIINNTSTGFDDIYVDHTNATLCGEGVMNIGNGSPDPTIQYFNGASLNQICSSFTVTCSMSCPGGFPMTGTGSFSSGNSGPGGVGSVTSSGDVRLWLDANSINQATGTNVSGWTDQSGYGNNASAPGGNEPVFNTNQLNGFPAVQFTTANSDFLQVADDASLDIGNVSMFVVGNLEASSTAYAAFISKIQSGVAGFNGYALLRNNATQGVSFAIDALGNEAQSGITYGVDAIHSSIYSDPGLEHFVNEGGPSTDTYAGPITSHNTPLYLGGTVNAAGATPDRFLQGDISEVIVTNAVLNDAKRIIVDNYLSSKYAIATANDNYSMDTPGNGNYDYEVAGIGQAADGSSHRDARGSGVVRMWNPNNLGNSEFLMWGHDNTALNSSTTAVGTAVDGTVIQERLSRIWRVSETGDVGNVSISFDFSGVGGSPLGSNLRLLIDRDGDGFADNDVTPIVGSVSNGVATFSNVNFQNGDRFTLGNTDASSPLPVELVMFKANTLRDAVKLNWTTASELNNDFFNIERSVDAEQWVSIETVSGAGTTSNESTYETIDYQPITGVSYYRLRQTDFDGKVSFSPIEQVNFTGENFIRAFPNPSDGVFYLENSSQLDVASVRVVNNLGQVVSPIVRKEGDISVDLSQLSNGIYILQVWNGSSLIATRLVKRN